MDNKKKQCGEVLYRVRYVLLFSMVLSIYLFIFSANSYASISLEDFTTYVDNTSIFLNEKCNLYPTYTQTYFPWLYDRYYNNIIYSNNGCDYGNMIMFYNGDSVPFYILETGKFSIFLNNDLDLLKIKNISNETAHYKIWDIRFDGVRWENSNNDYILSSNQEILITNSNYKYYSANEKIFYENTSNIIEDENILYTNVDLTPPIVNSITLTATSNHKFGFNDKNQLIITTTGDINIHDYNYYVQRFIDNEWEYMTFSSNDYLYLSNFENPWYVFFPNLNYFPVGTYRYVAGNDAETPIYISNEFEITQSIVDNNGTATGTIDPNNGDVNVDVNIDTGKTVDDVKDYFGGQANFDNTTISQEDIENNLNIEQTVSPYDNFVLTFINGLIGSLTDAPSKDFTFKVHTWGNTYTVKTSDIIPNYGPDLSNFLRLMSIIAFGFVLVKWSTKLVEAINVGDVSKSLELVEEKYSDLL